MHDLPDFVYYDHSAHLNAKDAQGKPKLPLTDAQGKPMVACQNCHGKVDEMEIVSVQHALQHAVVPRLPPEAGDEGLHRLRRRVTG